VRAAAAALDALPGGPVLYTCGVPRRMELERWRLALPSRRLVARRTAPPAPQALIKIGFKTAPRVGRPYGRTNWRPRTSSLACSNCCARRSQGPVLVIGLSPVDGAVMPYAGCLWYELAALRAMKRPA